MESPFAPGPSELRWAARLRVASAGSVRPGRLAALLAAVTWLPMLVLSFAEGTAYGGDAAIPFLGDFVAIGRHLVALPILVLLHAVVDRELVRAIGNLRDSGLVRPADESGLQRKIDRARELWLSPSARLLLLAFIVVAAIVMVRVATSIDAPDWMLQNGPAGPVLSAAGWWNLVVAGPVFRLLVLFTLWKLAIWSWFLLQLARMPLNYQILHADGCAGLGALERVQFGFSGVAAALAIQLGCVIADAVTYKGLELTVFRLPAIAFVVLMLLLLFAPFAAFIGPLSRAKVRAELAFNAWLSRASHQVEGSLQETGSKAIAGRLSSQDLSALTDAAALYAGALRTRAMPITRRSFAIVVLASVVPMVVPLLPLLPLKEIALRLAKVVM